MAAEFFVDTSAWYALVVAADPNHDGLAGALRAQLSRRRRPVMTNLVVAETHALLLRRRSHRTALAFLRSAVLPPNLIVHSTPELEQVAFRDWLERFADQDFSLADAVSFAVMTERRIEEVLTLDHHFTVAGFRAVRA